MLLLLLTCCGICVNFFSLQVLVEQPQGGDIYMGDYIQFCVCFIVFILLQVLAEQPHMWAGGDIYMGDYILLVDADTRVPSDCLLDGVSEMQQDGDVAIMQYTTEPFLVSLHC